MVKEYRGTTYDREKLSEAAKKAIEEGKTSLDARGKYYTSPRITAESDSVKNQTALMKKYEGKVITLKSGKKTVILDWKRFMRHMNFADGAKVDETWLSGYVRSLNANFSTAGKPVTFKAGGKTLTAPGGTYGKVVNVSKEIAQLRKDILAGENVTRTVNMTTNGNNTLKTGTFLLVSIAHQTVTGYRNGKVILHSSVVTGKETAYRLFFVFFFFQTRVGAIMGISSNFRTPQRLTNG